MKTYSAILLAFAFCCGGCKQGYFINEAMVMQAGADEKRLRSTTGSDGWQVIYDNTIQKSLVNYRTAGYRHSRISSEWLQANDSFSFINLYDRTGRIRLSFCLQKDSIVTGLTQFYGSNGKLNISANYENGRLREVVYYRNRRQLRRFKKRDIPIYYLRTRSISKTIGPCLRAGG